MKTERNRIRITSSGKVSSTLESLAKEGRGNLALAYRAGQRVQSQPGHQIYHLWIAFSDELDDSFARRFREEATSNTRLLVLNEGNSSDTLASRITDLQIRTSHRFYVADLSPGCGKANLAFSLLDRLASALQGKDRPNRILDAKIENHTLRVVSPNFQRLEVPISKIRSFEGVEASKINAFEIDKHGSFIYWPDLDVHLGWEQLQQIVNPEAARKALQKSQEFNVRYGRAARKVREQAGLKRIDIAGISEKQLRRIESGECRMTSNAVKALATAHKLAPNAYLNKLGEALD